MRRKNYYRKLSIPAEQLLPQDEAERIERLSLMVDEALSVALNALREIVANPESSPTHRIGATNAVASIARALIYRRRALGATEALSVTLPPSLRIQVAPAEDSRVLPGDTQSPELPATPETNDGQPDAIRQARKGPRGRANQDRSETALGDAGL